MLSAIFLPDHFQFIISTNLNYYSKGELSIHFNEPLLNNINSSIKKLSNQLEALPNDSLHFQRNGKYTKFYLYKNGSKTILPASSSELIRFLIKRKFYEFQLEDLMLEKNLLEKYLQKQSQLNSKYDKFINRPQIHELLLSSLYNSGTNSIFEDKPISSPPHPDTLKYKSKSGNVLRSKSERLIDQFFFQNNLQYRYEYPLELNGTTLHPDFSIIRNSDNKLIICEHFGMMDNTSYSQNAIHKLGLYIENGHIPNINLITTYETAASPLDSQQLEMAGRILHI